MPNPKLKKWTVVGFYDDNNQPVVVHDKAPNPQEAARNAMAESESPVRVVEVFAGHLMGTLGNDEVL